MKATMKRECILKQFPIIIGKINDAQDEAVRRVEQELDKYINDCIGLYRLGTWPFRKPLVDKEAVVKYLKSCDMFGDIYYYDFKHKIDLEKIRFKKFQTKLEAMLEAAKTECFTDFYLDADEINAIQSWLEK